MINVVYKIIQFVVFATLMLMSYLGFSQFKIPDVPKLQTSVYDYADVLNPSEEKALEDKLIHFSDSTTTQIVIITIESLKGEDIGILTPRWGQEWGIGGTEKNDNGIIILLAKEERKIWISPGYGIEQYLTAGINGEIVRNIILPEFKAGSYYNGLNNGTTAIFEVIKGTYKGKRLQNKKNDNPFPFVVFFVILIVIFILLSKNKKNGGGNNGTGQFGGPGILDMIILSSLGRSGGGFGGGGSSGGGFGGGGFGGGFGGGGFSGGGAGGSW